MRIKMELLSDTIFGNGMSVPGGEDISVLCDEHGFPYYKGTTLKGVFREELERYIEWTGKYDSSILGESGGDFSDDRLIFSDLKLSEYVRNAIKKEVEDNSNTVNTSIIRDMLTNIRTFTRINEYGIADEGSLRMARCVNSGLIFYGEIICKKEQEDLIKDVLGLIKSIGTHRNRGFGSVIISDVEE